MQQLIMIIAAYLLGSLSSAIITCKLAGLPDPRSQGSGNPGATNVLRFGGKRLAIIALLGDLLKGLIPVLLANTLFGDAYTVAASGLAAFLGHLYPVYFGFRGGKGVATGLGVVLAISVVLGLAALASWLITVSLFRTSSLAALVAAALITPFAWLLNLDPAYLVMLLTMSLLLIWRHRSNIHNLIHGTEPKISKKTQD